MLFKELNVLDELKKENQKLEKKGLLDFVNDVFQEEVELERRINDDLKNNQGSASAPINNEKHLVFTESSIRNICVKYRLRFLDSSLFKDEIPFEAVQKIKSKEKELNLELRKFKIIAPASRFSLKDSTKDPILLAETTDGKYLFIHKWGKDMEWYQKLLNFPFSNIQNLAISSALAAVLLSLLIPNSITPEFYLRTAALGFLYRVLIFFTLTGLIFSASLALGIIFSKDFSDDVWNDKYFN